MASIEALEPQKRGDGDAYLQSERKSIMIRSIMKSMVIPVVLAVVFVGLATAFAQEVAQQKEQPQAQAAPQIKRTVVIKSDLEGMPGKQLLAWVAELAPGATSGWHYHPYDEFVYILDGAVTMQIKGQAPVTLNPGETFHVPANTAHRATNVSETSQARGLVLGLTSKGEPLAVPVKK